MQIRIGLENNIEGRTLAWALDYPGCFAFGEDETEALIRLPRALLQYEIWIKDHATNPWIDFTNLDMHVVERYDTFRFGEGFNLAQNSSGYEINAWFKDDWRPLSAEQIDKALKIFHWQREELLGGISTLAPQTLEKERPGERWNILGIVKHIANGELWYLTRLDLTHLTRKELPKDPDKRLMKTAELVDQIFPGFAGNVNVKGCNGEFWSYRKILRRTLWHQRDHIEHIKSLVLGK